MGHDKSIHKSHYRQSIPELDIPKFSRLLNVVIFNTEEDNDYDDDNDDDDETQNFSEHSIGSPKSRDSNYSKSNDKISSLKTPGKKRRNSKYIYNKMIFKIF